MQPLSRFSVGRGYAVRLAARRQSRPTDRALDGLEERLDEIVGAHGAR